MISKRTFFWNVLMASAIGAVLGVLGYGFLFPTSSLTKSKPLAATVSAPFYPSYIIDSTRTVLPEGVHFVYAAQSTIPSVVHVRIYAHSQIDLLNFFLDDSNRDKKDYISGTGSGVIISSDGYVVTNYHVVENSSKIEVILSDNRAFDAELIGTDPSTDLALLRIEATDLRAIPIGDSDKLEIGAWVLAVGNPFELRSTVTAGIVSAKGRNIQGINGTYGIESFIQTDAVVNRGNSGGALVNLRGELVGINAAIYTETGRYEGYSFAVPSTLVQKVTDDLRMYGKVQRALLGIEIVNLNAHLAREKGIPFTRGVFVIRVSKESAAAEAGLLPEDIIIAINEEAVFSVPQLQEKIALKRPGEQVSLSLLRQKKEYKLSVTLKGLP